MWMPSSTAAITSNNNVRTSLILIVHLFLGKRELAHLLLDPLYLKTNECSIHNIAIRQLDKHLNIEYSVRVMRDDERRSYAGRGF